MEPRWKGKGAKAKALSDPMSKIVSELQASMLQSNSQGILTSSCVLLDADANQASLLSCSGFGRPCSTPEMDKQWFQLSMEEAFYLCWVLKCMMFVDVTENNCQKTDEELWRFMLSNRLNFVDLFKAYSHLRKKNWVVKLGSQYGVDFVAYRHHPSLVHAEYAVLVLSEDDGEANGRLRVWTDYQGTLRLCGSVAKTLLLLNIQKHGKIANSPLCLESFTVEAQTVTRWNPEQCREEQTVAKKES